MVADRGGVEAILDILGAVRLLRGKVVDVERSATDGFVRGSAVIADMDGEGRLLRLEIQNEFLVAIEDGYVRASVPAVIAVIDSYDQSVVTTERLRYGQRVDVIALPTTVRAAAKVTETDMRTGFVDAKVIDGLCRFMFLGNLTGLQALSAPVGCDAVGLPVGLQLLGDAWDEATILADSAHLERIGVAVPRQPRVTAQILG